MTILNLMLGKKRGGLEQAALDYAEALAHAGIPALTVISPKSWVEAPLVVAGMQHESLANIASWDPIALFRLRCLAERTRARAIICHGNRALGLALHALHGRVPVIAVAHNYHTESFIRSDLCLSITDHLADHLRKAGVNNIQPMPNMVRFYPAPPRSPYRTPPVIGSMGRFVAKKGFTDFIEALAIVKSRGVDFRAVLGGEGDMRPTLDALIEQYDLQRHVTLTGWVKDKSTFFDMMDIFVLPSLQEPFGIVLLEAMAHRLPIVTTASEGPREIVRHGTDALLVPLSNPTAMADAIIRLMQDRAMAQTLGEAGYQRVLQEYSMQAMASRLKTALAPYIA